MRVLQLLAGPEAVAGLTVTEIATALGLGRPIVYRLVATLEDHRLVARRPDGRVRLDVGLGELAAAVRPALTLDVAPVLRSLADGTGATAHLTVLEGDLAVALAVVEPSWTDFHVAYRVGSRHALDRGAAGRAILAGRENRWGAVQSTSELQPGAHGLAMPVRTSSGSAASVGLVALEPLKRPTVEPLLARAAEALAPLL